MWVPSGHRDTPSEPAKTHLSPSEKLTTFPLLQLPLELRNQIYTHLFPLPIILKPSLPHPNRYRRFPPAHALFHVSRQLRREALSIFYEHVTLRHPLQCSTAAASRRALPPLLGAFAQKRVRAADLRWSCSAAEEEDGGRAAPPLLTQHEGIAACVVDAGREVRRVVRAYPQLRALYLRLELDASFSRWWQDDDVARRLGESGLLGLAIERGGKVVVHLVLRRECMACLAWRVDVHEEEGESSRVVSRALRFLLRGFLDALPPGAELMLGGLPLANRRVVTGRTLGLGDRAWVLYLRRMYREDSLDMPPTIG